MLHICCGFDILRGSIFIDSLISENLNYRSSNKAFHSTNLYALDV